MIGSRSGGHSLYSLKTQSKAMQSVLDALETENAELRSILSIEVDATL